MNRRPARRLAENGQPAGTAATGAGGIAANGGARERREGDDEQSAEEERASQGRPAPGGDGWLAGWALAMRLPLKQRLPITQLKQYSMES